MYKCPKCGGEITVAYIVPEIAVIYDIISKPNKNGHLDEEYLKTKNVCDFEFKKKIFGG